MRLFLAVILLLLVFLMAMLFADQNDQQILVDYLIGSHSFSVVSIITFSLLIGLVIGLILASWSLFKLKVQLKHKNNQLKKAQQELANLRIMPVKDEL